METVAMIFLCGLTVLLDFRPVLRSGDKKAAWVYGVLLGVSFVVLVIAPYVHIPSPITPLMDAIFRLMGSHS